MWLSAIHLRAASLYVSLSNEAGTLKARGDGDGVCERLFVNSEGLLNAIYYDDISAQGQANCKCEYEHVDQFSSPSGCPHLPRT